MTASPILLAAALALCGPAAAQDAPFKDQGEAPASVPVAAAPAASSGLKGVKPCHGAAGDADDYCCEKPRRLFVLVVPDYDAADLWQKYVERAKELLSAHGVTLSVVSRGVDLRRAVPSVDNFAELCLAIDAALPSTEESQRFAAFIPVVFVRYNDKLISGGDSNAMHIWDLHNACDKDLLSEYGDEAGAKKSALTPHQRVIVINKNAIDRNQCPETLTHELGHGMGLSHDTAKGAPDNVMSACKPDLARSKLNAEQVRRFCGVR